MLKELVQLASTGIDTSAVMKKRRYWLTGIDGEAIGLQFNFKEIGTTDSLSDTFNGANL
jgi:hypothetical protein